MVLTFRGPMSQIFFHGILREHCSISFLSRAWGRGELHMIAELVGGSLRVGVFSA